MSIDIIVPLLYIAFIIETDIVDKYFRVNNGLFSYVLQVKNIFGYKLINSRIWSGVS